VDPEPDPKLNYVSGSEHANNFGSGRVRIRIHNPAVIKLLSYPLGYYYHIDVKKNYVVIYIIQGQKLSELMFICLKLQLLKIRFTDVLRDFVCQLQDLYLCRSTYNFISI
jgi:hypothetical protein